MQLRTVSIVTDIFIFTPWKSYHDSFLCLMKLYGATSWCWVKTVLVNNNSETRAGAVNWREFIRRTTLHALLLWSKSDFNIKGCLVFGRTVTLLPLWSLNVFPQKPRDFKTELRIDRGAAMVHGGSPPGLISHLIHDLLTWRVCVLFHWKLTFGGWAAVTLQNFAHQWWSMMWKTQSVWHRSWC